MFREIIESIEQEFGQEAVSTIVTYYEPSAVEKTREEQIIAIEDGLIDNVYESMVLMLVGEQNKLILGANETLAKNKQEKGIAKIKAARQANK